MDRTFWLEAWKQGRTGFHRDEVHPELLAHAGELLPAEDGPQRVLVPLCGKTRDLDWLAGRGHRVVGVELSDIAARAVFEEAGREVTVRDVGGAPVYTDGEVSVVQADVFELTREQLAEVVGGAPTRVWDRAALVALPPELRGRYVAQIRALAAPGAVVLLDAFTYDPAVMSGPPFSVPEAEVRAHYAGAEVRVLRQRDIVAEEPRWAEAGHRWWLETTYLIRLPG